MLVSLALSPLFGLFLIFQNARDDWRSSFLSSAVTWGLLIALATEGLSLFGKLQFLWVLVFWIVVSTGCFGIYFKYFPRERWVGLHGLVNRLGLPFFVILCGLIVQVLTNLLVALSAPPNNWDSMTYHMARVVHWIQNGSVYYYPTNIERQLWLNPWAEFAITHFQILSGGDRFANMLQGLSMVGSLLGISLVAKQLGANTREQVFASVVAGTIPMGVLQASSTQNDYVVTFWLICFFHFGLRLISLKSWDRALPDSIKSGIALGLSLATKGTAYVFAFPFALWLGFAALKAKGIKPVVAISVVALSINMGYYARNLDLYGNPLGPCTHSLSPECHSVAAVISNVTRNLALHVSTPIKSINHQIVRGLKRFHELIGIDIDDPRTTYSSFQLPKLAPNEDTSGNPIHLLLILVSLTVLVSSKQWDHLIGLYSLCVVAASFLFCLSLKWQPWASRLHLPLFVLTSPVVAILLTRILGTKGAIAVCVVLLLSALPWLLLNQTRPLLALDLLPKSLQTKKLVSNPKFVRAYGKSVVTRPKFDQMFQDRPKLQASYEAAAAFVRARGYHKMGLHLGGDDWEYPFWDLLNRDDIDPVRIEHFGVVNASKRKACNERTDNFSPDCIISLVPSDGNKIKTGSGCFVKQWNSGPVNIFERETGR